MGGRPILRRARPPWGSLRANNREQNLDSTTFASQMPFAATGPARGCTYPLRSYDRYLPHFATCWSGTGLLRFISFGCPDWGLGMVCVGTDEAVQQKGGGGGTRLCTGGGGAGMHWIRRSPPSGTPSLRPATVPLTPSASLNDICTCAMSTGVDIVGVGCPPQAPPAPSSTVITITIAPPAGPVCANHIWSIHIGSLTIITFSIAVHGHLLQGRGAVADAGSAAVTKAQSGIQWLPQALFHQNRRHQNDRPAAHATGIPPIPADSGSPGAW